LSERPHPRSNSHPKFVRLARQEGKRITILKVSLALPTVPLFHMSVQTTAVVGAGTMGNGIAHVFALHGYDVTLIDLDEDLLDDARATIESNLSRQVNKDVIAAEEKTAAYQTCYNEDVTCEQVKEWNWMYWCNEEYDRLHDEGMREMDQEAREGIYIEMQKLMDEAAHSVWISHPTSFFVAKNTISPSVMATGEFIPWRFTSK